MGKKNKCTIVVRDINREAGEVEILHRFDDQVDVEKGPQSPAEEVAALAMTFMQRQVCDNNEAPYYPKTFYGNTCTLVIADKNGEGEIDMKSSFEREPDITWGPQTPAESIMALTQTFLKTNVFDEHKTGAILLPEDWVGEGQGVQ